MMIETDNGRIEVYKTAIERIASEYVEGLAQPEDIKNPMSWRGCLLAIHEELFQPAGTLRYNVRTNLDIENPQQIYDVWKLYCNLSYQYKHYISIGRFCLMTGLHKHTITNWGHGNTRAVNDAYLALYKNMMSDCESCLEDMATESNGIGAIFNLKSKHNWVEKSAVPTEQYLPTAQHSTPEQIAQKYADIAKPVLIDTDD